MSQQQIIAAQVSGGVGGAAGTVDVTVANNTGSTINKSSVVDWAYSADGSGNPKVFASSATDAPGGGNHGSEVFGILLADLTAGGTATCRIIGAVTGLDTHLFSVGTDVYAGDSGALVGSATSTGHAWVGTVLVSNASTGSVFVGCGVSSIASVSVHSHAQQLAADGGALSIASFTEVDVATVATPASTTYQNFFVDQADHKLKHKDHAGTVTIIG